MNAAEYKLTEHENIVVRIADGIVIPEGNWLWDQYQQWLADGNTPDPVGIPDQNEAIIAEISELESQITDRRIREAIIGTDGGWLKAQDEKIAALRHKLVF